MLARQPLAFIENQGQWAGGFSHLARFGPMSVFLEDRGWSFTLTELGETRRGFEEQAAQHGETGWESSRGVAVRMRFSNGADAVTPVPEQRLPGAHNYFLGDDPEKWRSDVPLHASVRMAGLYPGIDVRARSQDGHFEYDLLVAPGAELFRVEVEVEGADRLWLDEDGALVMGTALGPVRQPMPKTWQVGIDGEHQEVLCSYVLFDDTRFGFTAPEWDRKHALVVDPGLIWSTFLGGGSRDVATAVAVGPSGAVTVAGRTLSTNFPTTLGAFTTTHGGGGGDDGFVSRLDGAGSNLLWSTFIGGSAGDEVHALAVEASGVVTVAGSTVSSNFPTTPGAYDTTFNGFLPFFFDGFVTRLDATGSSLLWSTYLGGSADDRVQAVAVDGSGTVTVAGLTVSSAFPTTPGAYASTYGGGVGDGFVARFDPTGGSLLWSTFLGGGAADQANAVTLDGSGAVTVAGWTGSASFPTTPGAYDTSYNGGGVDGFVSRLDAVGSTLLWSSFLGGSAEDLALAMAVDPSGAVTVTGETRSSTFPTTAGAYDTSHNGGYDVFVTRLEADGSNLMWSTFVGGAGDDRGNSLALDAAWGVTVAGETSSFAFPATAGAYATAYNGGFSDGFVTWIDGTGGSLLWSTFLGGSGDDQANGLARDATGMVTVAGGTRSSLFPTTSGAYAGTYAGGSWDGFVSRFDPALGPPTCPAGACLDMVGVPAVGNSVAVWLQSPAVGAPCYVLADTQTGAVPLGTYGFTQIALTPNVVPLADPSGTFGASLTFPYTDATGFWTLSVALPNDPGLVGLTLHVEAYVADPAASNGLFWQSNLLTATVQ